jgi:hypothetical protein
VVAKVVVVEVKAEAVVVVAGAVVVAVGWVWVWVWVGGAVVPDLHTLYYVPDAFCFEFAYHCRQVWSGVNISHLLQ